MSLFPKILVMLTLAQVSFGQARLVSVIASIYLPSGVAKDRAGNTYIASYGNSAVYRVDASSQEITTLFRPPGVKSLAVDDAGNVYCFDDFGGGAIMKWSAATHDLTTLITPVSTLNGINTPLSMAADDAGNVYIADPRSGSGGTGDVWMWNAATQQLTIVWIGFDGPTGVATDRNGYVYVADGGAIYKFNAKAFTPLVTSGLAGDVDLAVDDSGNVYIADGGNNAIKKWSASTKQVTTVVSGLNAPRHVAVDRAGNLDIVELDDAKRWNASTHQLSTLMGSDLPDPVAVAVDSLGNVYVSDNLLFALKVWHPSTRQITTAASGVEADGIAIDGSNNVFITNYASGTVSQVNPVTQQLTTLFSGMNRPTGLAVDHLGNLYVCIPRNNVVSKLGHPGAVLISSGVRYPYAVAVDGSGNLYVADMDNNAIKKWNASTQSVTTLVSSGLSGPHGVAVDADGNVFIADTGHGAIKKWTASTQQVTTLVADPLSFPGGIAVDRDGVIYFADTSSLKAIVPIVRRRAIAH